VINRLERKSALGGIRILDVTRYLAGPVTGMLLADMGAEVIHVERPKTGDETRASMTGSFETVNRNKKSITLNLASDKGQELFQNLVKKSDIVIENNTPGMMAKFNCDYQALKKINEKIILVSISGCS